jgi:hypothetical protein
LDHWPSQPAASTCPDRAMPASTAEAKTATTKITLNNLILNLHYSTQPIAPQESPDRTKTHATMVMIVRVRAQDSGTGLGL